MSQTQQQQQFPIDPYLAQQTAPPQEIKLDPQFGSVRLITPVGRLAYVTLVKPRAVEQNGQKGVEQFSCTILLASSVCQDIYRAIAMVATNRWPSEQRPDPQNPSNMIAMTGEQMLFLPKEQGGLHYPLRDGNNTYMRDPKKYEAFRGLFSLNASIAAINPGTGASQQPVCLDESGRNTDPTRFYSGCYGRLQVTFFAFPKPGRSIPNRGVGVSLNAVQFARHGEKLATFDAGKAAEAAFAAAGALPVEQPQPGFGVNQATPSSVPPGIPGFAAPPAPPAGPPAGGQPNWQGPQAQQPWQPATGGARPPGI